MTKKKIFGILVVALVIIGCAFAVLVKVLITPERVKARLLPLAQQALQRDVEIGEIQVSLLSGIVVKNIRIKEKTGTEDFVAADEILLRYQLWPLLSLDVVVDEISLKRPQITIIRMADGNFNFSDLAGASATDTQATTPSGPKESPTDNRQQAIDLLVSKVRISDGELQFVDYLIAPQAPYRYKMTDLTIQAENISLTQAFPFLLKARLNGSDLAVNGSADLAKGSGQVNCQLNELDVTSFAPYFRDQLPGTLGALKLTLDLATVVEKTSVDSHGKILLQNIDLTLNALPDAPLRNGSLGLDYAVQVDPVGATVEIGRANIDLNGILFDISGQVADYLGSPKVKLVARLNNLDLRAALAALPEELVRSVEDLDPAGSVEARINLAGSLDHPQSLLQNGEVNLTGIQASVGELRPSLTGLLTLSGAQVAADKLVLNVGDNRAEVNFQIANLFDQPIRITSLLRSERFLLDPLLKAGGSRSAGSAESGTAGKQPTEKPPVEEIGPFDLPVELKGEIRIGQTLYRGLALEDFFLRYRLVDNVFTLEEMTGKMAGGTFREEATVDLGKKGLVYSGTLNLSGVQADPLLTALVPDAAGTVLGGLSLDTKFSGKGTLTESIRKNLSGKGNLELADGRLSAVPIMQGLASFLKLEELRDLHFSGAKGNYTLQNGKILLQSQVTGNDVTMSPAGSVGLDGSLNLQLGARLAPRLAAKLDRKGEISQLFTAQDGWTELPMQVAGSWSKPKLSLDTTAVTSKITEKAVSRLQQKLEEKAKKRQAEGADDKSTQDPTKDLINDALKGLFGK